MKNNKEELELVPIGPLIDRMLKAKKISVKEVSERMCITKTAVYDILKKESIDGSQVLFFSELLNVSTDFLLRRKKYESNNNLNTVEEIMEEYQQNSNTKTMSTFNYEKELTKKQEMIDRLFGIIENLTLDQENKQTEVAG